MKRTIEVKRGGHIFYKGRCIAKAMYHDTRQHFLRLLGKYQIEIKKGNAYQIKRAAFYTSAYRIRNIKTCHEYSVCRSAFRKLFFTPNRRERYDITVKRAK